MNYTFPSFPRKGKFKSTVKVNWKQMGRGWGGPSHRRELVIAQDGFWRSEQGPENNDNESL